MPDAENLAAWSAFCTVSAADAGVQALAGESRKLRLETSVSLIEQGSPSQDVFLITSGELKTVLYTENGHEIWLAKVTKGDLVGEIGALSRIERTSSVISTQPVHALMISAGTFRDAVNQYASVSGAIATMIAKRLHNTTEKLAEQVAMPVTSRVHSELARLGTQSDADTEKFFIEIEIEEELTISDLANRIHATREATSRAVSELRRRGLVRRSEGTWTVIVPMAK